MVGTEGGGLAPRPGDPRPVGGGRDGGEWGEGGVRIGRGIHRVGGTGKESECGGGRLYVGGRARATWISFSGGAGLWAIDRGRETGNGLD